MPTKKSPWTRFIELASGGAKDTLIAERVGVSQSTVSRWKSGALQPDAAKAIDFARAYGLNPLDALVAAGYLTTREVNDWHVGAPKAVWAIESAQLVEAYQMADSLTSNLGSLIRLISTESPDLPQVRGTEIDPESLTKNGVALAALSDPELDQDEHFD